MQLIENATSQKLRGAYYTPPVIARFILQWGINGSSDLVTVYFWSALPMIRCFTIALLL